MVSSEKINPTLADVARQAGVSTATVSRVLSQPDTVSERRRLQVGKVIALLGYVPHAGARALVLRRTGTVGAIFPTVDNAIFATAIDALQGRLAESNLQLLLATSGYDPANEMRQGINLVTRGADALVLCGQRQHPELLNFLRQRQVPCVHVMVSQPAPDRIIVGFDNAAAMRRATRYLIDLGHRRIAMLAGVTRDNDRAEGRVEGVREALHAAGLELVPDMLVERRYALDEARSGLRSLMAVNPAPTAIVCGNDVLAFGALLEAAALGVRVPHDLSIVGCDDLELARHLQPSLTTVRVPTVVMWRTAAERLLGVLRGEVVPPCTEVEVALVVRDSTAPVLG